MKWPMKWNVVIAALILLLLALWPRAGSLYELTGREERTVQIAGMVHWINTAIRPSPHLSPQTVQHRDKPLYAINTFLQYEVEVEKRAQSLALIRAAGFEMIRQEFTWEDIEIYGKGDFEDRRNVADIGVVDAWAKYDNIVDLAGQYEIQILARLSNPPAWSRTLPDEEIGSLAPPDDFNDFADFAAAVAERYRGRITYFQVWNEPNGNEEWGLRDVDPEAYTELLCLSYDRIKAANPEAVVLAAALTPTMAMDGRHMNELIYLQRMYNAGAADCFDAMSVQGYGLWSGAQDRRLRPTVINYPRHLFIRDIMVRQGDGHKPIWISEMGWNVVPDGMPDPYGRVTEAQQARYAVEAYERAQREWPWLGSIAYWFFKRPGDGERNEPWYYFRMMEPDFTPLPVYEAMVAHANEAQVIDPVLAWTEWWDWLRPLLFLLSSTILFGSLLHGLAQGERGDARRTAEWRGGKD
jgi:polysaccharide biosynthesis protein PslG